MSENNEVAEVTTEDTPKVAPCDRCQESLTNADIKLASEDNLHYCAACRAKLNDLRARVKQAADGRFKTGL